MSNSGSEDSSAVLAVPSHTTNSAIPSSSQNTIRNGTNSPTVSTQISRKLQSQTSIRSILSEKRKSRARIAPIDSSTISNTNSKHSKNNKLTHAISTSSLARSTKSGLNKDEQRMKSSMTGNHTFWEDEMREENQENENPIILNDTIDKYLMFIQAVKLENPLPRLVSLSIHISLEVLLPKICNAPNKKGNI